MARTKYRKIRRRKRPAEATSSSPAKKLRTDRKLQPGSDPGCSSNTTSAATSALITATGSSVSANKPAETTASAKKLSLKKPTVDSDDFSHKSDDSASSSNSDTVDSQ